jgi:hypothetical protein
MGRKKEQPRYNILTLRVGDYTLVELQKQLNGASVSSYINAALEEKLVRDRQYSLDEYLRENAPDAD